MFVGTLSQTFQRSKKKYSEAGSVSVKLLHSRKAVVQDLCEYITVMVVSDMNTNRPPEKILGSLVFISTDQTR